MKKVFSLILALGLIASLTACGGGNASGNETGDSAPAAPTAKLRFVTGGESGTYYAFGSVIAQHATNNTNVSVTGLVGNGSKSNVEELADGNAELAFCQSDVMAYAYNGTNLFEEEHLQLTTEGAELISRLADGAMRDALSILDTCAGVTSQIDASVVRKMAGVTDRSYLFRISDAIAAQDGATALACLAQLPGRPVLQEGR